MSPSAAVVSADLADAAVETTALTRARKLARWLGPGRELTSQGVLRSAAAPDADAATMVSVIREVPPPVAQAMARPWLDARSADAAVRELLALAEAADGEQRAAALAFARGIGPEAAPAWREWAGQPGFGAYARRWLADQGEPAAGDPADEAWLTVDALSIMLAALPGIEPAPLLDAVLHIDAGREVPEALTLLRGCGHPAAASIVARLTGQPELVPVPAGTVRVRLAAAIVRLPRDRPVRMAGDRWGLAPVWLSRPD